MKTSWSSLTMIILPGGEAPLTPIKRPLEPSEVRIKIGNFALFAWQILNIGKYNAHDELGNPSRILRAWPVGGSALLFDSRRIEKIGAFNLPDMTYPADAKFWLERKKVHQLLKIVSVSGRSNTFECSLLRELLEELALETFPGRREKPILLEEDIAHIKAKYRGILVYETKREEDDGMNMSINRLFDIDMPKRIERKLARAKSVIYTPTQKEYRKGEMHRDGEIVLISRKAQLFNDYRKGRIAGFERNIIEEED